MAILFNSDAARGAVFREFFARELRIWNSSIAAKAWTRTRCAIS